MKGIRGQRNEYMATLLNSEWSVIHFNCTYSLCWEFVLFTIILQGM